MFVALQALAGKYQTTSMRLWGKILGSDTDYYIAEGQLSDAYEPEDPSAEEGADGLNKLTYWAMKDDGAYLWTQLPPVTRQQILIARKLKRFVSSDLESQVASHPPFPGTQKSFLRAQIARITSATLLSPAGFFDVSDDGEVTPSEEVEPKSADELADLGNWVHLSKEINAIYGRTNAMPPREGEDGEEQPWEGEEFVPQLRSLSEDHAGIWRVFKAPDNLNPTVGEVAVVKSLLWPGAVSVGLGKRFLNIYVGNGIKYSSESYQPSPPKDLEIPFGISIGETSEEGAEPSLQFTNLQEQPDVLEDPTPPEAEADE